MCSWHVIFKKKTWGGGFFKHCVILGHPNHYHYGHCFTVDIAALSENQGKYKMKYGSHKMALTLLIKGEFENHYRWKHTLVFIHNGTNINQCGESIKGRPVFSGNTYDVSLSGINFKMY